MDKYLKVGNQKVIDLMDGAVKKIRPVWGLSWRQLVGNLKGVAKSEWPFS